MSSDSLRCGHTFGRSTTVGGAWALHYEPEVRARGSSRPLPRGMDRADAALEAYIRGTVPFPRESFPFGQQGFQVDERVLI